MNRRTIAACRFAFALALFVAPREFRRAYESRMFDTLLESVDDGFRRRGTRGGVGAALIALADGARAALEERIESIARQSIYSLRSLARVPLITSVSAGAIALGLGANLFVATIVHGVLLRPLPYAEPHQLFFVREADAGRAMTYPDAREFALRTRAFADVAEADFENRTLFGLGAAANLNGSLVSATYFPILGARPVLGRFFSEADAGRPNVVISYALWREKFGGAPSVVGGALHLNDRTYTIVGVGPEHFRDPTPFGLQDRSYWLPIDPRDGRLAGPGQFNYITIARVRSGLDSTTGAKALGGALAGVVRANGHHPHQCCAAITPMLDGIVAPARRLLWSAYAMVCVVLLIACVNVANLQFVRRSARENEIAIQAALGASPARLAIERNTETFFLVSAGATLGLLGATVALRTFAEFGSRLVPRWEDVRIDASTYVYSFALVVLSTVLVGTIPAMLRRRDIGRSLRGGRTTERVAVRRLRATLVVIQIGLAAALVIVAGLVAQSERRFTQVDVGFDAGNVAVIPMHLAPPRYVSDASRARFVRDATERLRAIPSVREAAASLGIPLGCCDSQSIVIPGRHETTVSVLYNAVSPSYFQTLHIPLRAGRTFGDRDRANAPCVVLVDETFEKMYFAAASSVGRTVRTSTASTTCTIVGVVGPIREAFGKPFAPKLYVPIAQFPEVNFLIVRHSKSNPRLAEAAIATLTSLDPTLPPPMVAEYASFIADTTFDVRANTVLFESLACLALLLALSGIYAVTSVDVARRTQEFGIRKAVGAQTRVILRDVLRGALGQCCIGVLIGTTLAAAFSHLLEPLLYETSPIDPGIYSATVLVFLSCATVAALEPALRATRVDPVVALRRD